MAMTTDGPRRAERARACGDWQFFSRGLFSVSPLSPGLLCLFPTSPSHVSAESGDYVDHSLGLQSCLHFTPIVPCISFRPLHSMRLAYNQPEVPTGNPSTNGCDPPPMAMSATVSRGGLDHPSRRYRSTTHDNNDARDWGSSCPPSSFHTPFPLSCTTCTLRYHEFHVCCCPHLPCRTSQHRIARHLVCPRVVLPGTA